ncbi:uncharacterized protein LOC114417982 [Glycine soja]|uniref:uncharacterized protein n=1 Tax=Glycine max TaxID=3847 RepID=UPI0003DE7FE4|nr:uncharacterized protein LOC102669324 [Glycine max]XP_028238931.1 uncharacterized protein LOC114417982 [Glycine soja]|eukprot:XP_006574080.1 uncharacterized protein LOC102669324 [Glycine max]
MIEVFVEVIASFTQYYDQPLRCFTFGDFQLVPTVEEFEGILGCSLGGRKSYLFSGFYPSMARVAKVVKISVQELERVKQNRNGVVGIPKKRLEEKAKALADQGEWTSFIDVLALLVFGVVLFPNVDGLMDLAAINAFLAYHHSKESSAVVVLVDAYDTFDQRCKKNNARIVCCTLALYVWLVFHIFHHESRHVCPLQGHYICAEKGKANWEQLMAGMVGASVNWFPRWKEGGARVLSSCEGFPNVPLMGTRGCINYNPVLVIRQLGYPMKGAPSEESIAPFIA